MTFSYLIDWYLYSAIEFPLALLAFLCVWMFMRWQSNWKLDIGAGYVLGGAVATIIGAGMLLTLANSLVFFAFGNAFFEHEIFPLAFIFDEKLIISCVLAAATAIGVCSFLKIKAKPMVAISA